MMHSSPPSPYSFKLVFFATAAFTLLTGTQPLSASTAIPLNTTSYINYVEDRIEFYENRDGLQSGDYGVQDGTLTLRELCNVGGQLVHTEEDFSKWSYQMYRMQLMTTSYYSALIGCASYPIFLQETMQPAQDDAMAADTSLQAIEQEKHNLDFLVGRYNSSLNSAVKSQQ